MLSVLCLESANMWKVFIRTFNQNILFARIIYIFDCNVDRSTSGHSFDVAGIHYATVYWRSEQETILVKDVLDTSGDAYGFYNDTVQSTGWGVLEMRAGYAAEDRSNDNIMFAAGYLEGYLTAL